MGNSQENKLGKKIRPLRIKIHFSQDKFARKAEALYTTLTKIETYVIKKTSVFIMTKIAKVANITLDSLLL